MVSTLLVLSITSDEQRDTDVQICSTEVKGFHTPLGPESALVMVAIAAKITVIVTNHVLSYCRRNKFFQEERLLARSGVLRLVARPCSIPGDLATSKASNAEQNSRTQALSRRVIFTCILCRCSPPALCIPRQCWHGTQVCELKMPQRQPYKTESL